MTGEPQTRAEREARHDRELLRSYERRCQTHDDYFEKRVAHLKERLYHFRDLKSDYYRARRDQIELELRDIDEHLKRIQGLV